MEDGDQELSTALAPIGRRLLQQLSCLLAVVHKRLQSVFGDRFGHVVVQLYGILDHHRFS